MTAVPSAPGGRAQLVVLVADGDEADTARDAGAMPVRSLDELGAFRRLDALVLANPQEPVAPGGSMLLLDTTPGRLLDRIAFPDLARLAALALERGIGIGFSGGLEAPDVPRLLPLKPSFLVFDEAARDTTGRLDAEALAALAALFVEPARPLAFEGLPDRVFVRDLVEDMEIGAYASERGRRQRVRFSVEAELAPRTGPRAAADIYSYDRMIDAVHALARRSPEPFVETLAETLASELLADARVTAVTVRVEKLDLGPAAAGVEIRRTRGA